MIRKLLWTLLPFLLPFVAYAIYWLLAKRAAARGKIWTDAPWYWLVASGLVLMIAALGASAFWGGAPPGSTYIPAQVKDGQIIPGRFE